MVPPLDSLAKGPRRLKVRIQRDPAWINLHLDAIKTRGPEALH